MSFNNLGYLTYHGKGVKQDFAEGLRLWHIAGEKGFHESQVHIGYAYYDGQHLRKNYIEAYAWLTTGKHYAAQAGDTAVLEMADQGLAEVRPMLNASQLSKARKKAAEYIAMYVPK